MKVRLNYVTNHSNDGLVTKMITVPDCRLFVKNCYLCNEALPFLATNIMLILFWKTFVYTHIWRIPH